MKISFWQTTLCIITVISSNQSRGMDRDVPNLKSLLEKSGVAKNRLTISLTQQDAAQMYAGTLFNRLQELSSGVGYLKIKGLKKNDKYPLIPQKQLTQFKNAQTITRNGTRMPIGIYLLIYRNSLFERKDLINLAKNSTIEKPEYTYIYSANVHETES